MNFRRIVSRVLTDTRGSVFVEYLLLVTIIGIGTIAGLASVRDALVTELTELAAAIAKIA